MIRLLVALLLGALAAGAASAQTTITFDPRPPGDPADGVLVRIGGYTEGGIVFTASPEPGSAIVEDSGGVPSNGTAFLSKCGICRPSFAPVAGGLFDLVSVDLGELLFFGFGPFATAVTITGVKEDGSMVSVDLTADGVAGFERFVLDERFVDLASAEISTLSPYAGLAIDNLTLVVGLDKPTLSVSPASGRYVTSQGFDLTLILEGADAATIAAATLDGADFSGPLAACAVVGELDAVPGVTFRCPLDGAFLGAGTHTFEATLELEDGRTVSESADWEVVANSEL